MTQERVAPQPQSLCFEEQPRQSQCSHQIHFRCCTSSKRRARIQRRIAVRDMPARCHKTERPAMGRSAHRFGGCDLPASSAGAAKAAGKEANQPDHRKHDGHDEQPVNDESDAERNKRQDRQQD